MAPKSLVFVAATALVSVVACSEKIYEPTASIEKPCNRTADRRVEVRIYGDRVTWQVFSACHGYALDVRFELTTRAGVSEWHEYPSSDINSLPIDVYGLIGDPCNLVQFVIEVIASDRLGEMSGEDLLLPLADCVPADGPAPRPPAEHD